MIVRAVTLLKRCSIVVLLIGLLWILTKLQFWGGQEGGGTAEEARNDDPEPKIQPVDIVYTWVNGSDPQLLESIDYHTAKLQRTKVRSYLQHENTFLTFKYLQWTPL